MRERLGRRDQAASLRIIVRRYTVRGILGKPFKVTVWGRRQCFRLYLAEPVTSDKIQLTRLQRAGTFTRGGRRHMRTGWSERVRDVADREYVQPARSGGSRVKIRFGDLRARMVRLGFPAGHFNQIATPLESAKFWQPRGLEMCTPKGQSRNDNTIFEFRFVDEPQKNQDRPAETDLKSV